MLFEKAVYFNSHKFFNFFATLTMRLWKDRNHWCL